MKKLLFIIAIVLFVISCSKEDNTTKQVSQKMSTKLADSLSIAYKPNLDSIAKMNAPVYKEDGGPVINPISSTPEYTDWSGLIHLQIFYTTVGKAQHNNASAQVPADFVCIGGGAVAWGWTGNGAYITASYPDPSFAAWWGVSKDHIWSDPHYLTVYAIGMKMDGVSPDYLRSKIHLYSQTSGSADAPSTSITIPSNQLLIGGGAQDNWTGLGNLLTASYPGSSTTWYVSGKDQVHADQSTITAYAIGIENISFPNVGYIQVGYSSAVTYVGSKDCSVSATIPTGWALTCCGACAQWNGFGRVLSGMYPNGTSLASVWSKDCGQFDGGNTYAYGLRVQKAH